MNSKMTELQSFIYKFHQLWSAGQSAHLDLDTHAGGAWVGLRVHLGHGHGPSNFQPQNKDSPSRQRRRVRRAAARQVPAEEASDEETANEKNAEKAVETAEQAEGVKDNLVAETNVNDSLEPAASTAQLDELAPIAEEASLEKCDQCESTFKTVRGLRAHKGRVHENILQLDGASEIQEGTYTFVSDFAEEDVKYTLDESLADEVDFEWISRVKTGNARSADHICTIKVSLPCDDWQWPILTGVQAQVFKNLKRGSVSSC